MTTVENISDILARRKASAQYKDNPEYRKHIDEIALSYSKKSIRSLRLAEKPIIPVPLMSPWIAKGSINMVHAAPGVGKTFFCLNVAYAIANGSSFLTYKVPKAAKVLYIDGEMPFYMLQQRYQTIMQQQGQLQHPDNFLLYSGEGMPVGIMPKISDKQGQQFYEDEILSEGVEFVVFDNLSALSEVDENKAHEWMIVQNWLISLRTRGITILLVHHTGKNKAEQRGTSKRVDILDTMISLQACDDPNEAHSKLKVIFQKHRHFGGADAAPCELTLTPYGGYEYRTLELSNFERTVEMAKNEMSQRDIAEELGISQSSVRNMVKKAKAQRLIPESFRK